MTFNNFTVFFLVMFVAHAGVELWLEFLQARHLAKRKDRVPSHLEGKVDIETIRKAVAYSREKLRFRVVSRFWDAIFLMGLVFSGFALWENMVASLEFGSIKSGLVFFVGLGFAGAVWGMPQELYFTFVIEKRHGFNRQTLSSFFMDKLKGGIVSLIMMGGLLSLVLITMEETGKLWWLIAFGVVTLVQLLISWLYPVLIMPIFNKFVPVDKSLEKDVDALAAKVGFPLKQVVSMDGSKRSSHSNAFIVGLFGARRIVLYDTLVEKLSRQKLIAVLAHELGHFKLGHIRIRLAMMIAGLLGVFAIIGWIASYPAASAGLGFKLSTSYAGLIAAGLLISEALFPVAWILRVFSRRDEYAADRFAVEAVENKTDLLDALVELSKQNLSSPGSHRYYRGYYNTHPALKDRLAAIPKVHVRQEQQ